MQEYRIVRNMALNILNLNANSVARLLNGFAGVLLISVNHAIKNNVKEIM